MSVVVAGLVDGGSCSMLRRLMAAVALCVGVLAVSPVSPVAATVTYPIAASHCNDHAGGVTSGARVCVDSSVAGVSGYLYVFANGGDSWTARAYVANRSEYINPGWVATAGDRWNGADNSFTANGSRFQSFPPANFVGPVRFCNFYDGLPTCSNDGATILATGSYAAFAIGSAKTAIAAGAPVYLL